MAWPLDMFKQQINIITERETQSVGLSDLLFD